MCAENHQRRQLGGQLPPAWRLCGPSKGLAGAQCTPSPAQPPSGFVVEHGAQPALRLCQVHLLAGRIVGHLRGWTPPMGPHSARRTAHPASKAVSLERTSSETRRNAGSRACRWPAQPTGFGGGGARAPSHLLTHAAHQPPPVRPPTHLVLRDLAHSKVLGGGGGKVEA